MAGRTLRSQASAVLRRRETPRRARSFPAPPRSEPATQGNATATSASLESSPRAPRPAASAIAWSPPAQGDERRSRQARNDELRNAVLTRPGEQRGDMVRGARDRAAMHVELRDHHARTLRSALRRTARPSAGPRRLPPRRPPTLRGGRAHATARRGSTSPGSLSPVARENSIASSHVARAARGLEVEEHVRMVGDRDRGPSAEADTNRDLVRLDGVVDRLRIAFILPNRRASLDQIDDVLDAELVGQRQALLRKRRGLARPSLDRSAVRRATVRADELRPGIALQDGDALLPERPGLLHQSTPHSAWARPLIVTAAARGSATRARRSRTRTRRSRPACHHAIRGRASFASTRALAPFASGERERAEVPVFARSVSNASRDRLPGGGSRPARPPAATRRRRRPRELEGLLVVVDEDLRVVGEPFLSALRDPPRRGDVLVGSGRSRDLLVGDVRTSTCQNENSSSPSIDETRIGRTNSRRTSSFTSSPNPPRIPRAERGQAPLQKTRPTTAASWRSALELRPKCVEPRRDEGLDRLRNGDLARGRHARPASGRTARRRAGSRPLARERRLRLDRASGRGEPQRAGRHRRRERRDRSSSRCVSRRPARAALSSSGRAVRRSSGTGMLQSRRCSRKSRRASSAQCRSSTTRCGRRAAIASRNRLQAVNDSSRAAPGAVAPRAPRAGASLEPNHARSASSAKRAAIVSSSLALASCGSSDSRIPASDFTISPSAQKVIPRRRAGSGRGARS